MSAPRHVGDPPPDAEGGWRRWAMSAMAARSRLISGIIVGVFAVGLLGGMAYAIATAAATYGPRQTAATLCAYLTHRDYSGAYELLSANDRAHMDRPSFMLYGVATDRRSGRVRDCGNVSRVEVAKDQAKVSMEITRDVKTSGSLLLRKEGDIWRLDAVLGSLQVIG
jgi:hypothetical protein